MRRSTISAEADELTSTRTTSPKRRLRSCVSTASSRSAASSETSKSASRRHAERGALENVGAGEEGRQEVRDDLLERDVEAAPADLEEAREALRDLHAREALLARLRVCDEDGEREREAGDVRERLARADRERRQHRVDLALVVALERRASSPSSQSSIPPMTMPSAASAGRSSFFQVRACRRDELEHALADARERLLRREPVRGEHREAGLGLAEQAGHPHLEELVEVRGEDRAELHALEQRHRLVPGQLEHAAVEVEQRQLPVEEARFGLAADACRQARIIAGARLAAGLLSGERARAGRSGERVDARAPGSARRAARTRA